MQRILWSVLALMAFLGVALAGLVAMNLRGEEPLQGAQAFQSTPELIAQGAYLARVGGCKGCHTAQGGKPYAGGRGMETPFGVVYAPNLTPDPATGLGPWSAGEFWRALHHGRSRDGRLLYPAFPYLQYTQVTRADADAIYAYLRSLPAVAQANRPHALGFPFNTQLALAGWRALFFKPGTAVPEAARSAQWNRGAYLVHGLGHCAACHTPRNALGGPRSSQPLGGGLIPVENWYAPALNTESEAGVAHWPISDVVALLQTGRAPQASVMGPMAEVVFGSTQYLTDADARAMAVYLQSLVLPRPSAPHAAQVLQAQGAPDVPKTAALGQGAQVYGTHCAQCHGEKGQGQPGAFPALAGNRAVTLADPSNLVRVLLQGGYLPATAGNPRPHGMPPFQQTLRDDEVAAVASFVRSAWGNQAGSVATIEVYRARERRSP
ncbi:MAG: cytochrome c [Simplicispira sp.]|nr:cytochrome c [Simplicispira sp.]